MHVSSYFFATSDLWYIWDKATPEGKAIIVILLVFSEKLIQIIMT